MMNSNQVFRTEASGGDPYEELAVSVLVQAIEDYRSNYDKYGLRREDIIREMRGNWLWEHFLPDKPFESLVEFFNK